MCVIHLLWFEASNILFIVVAAGVMVFSLDEQKTCAISLGECPDQNHDCETLCSGLYKGGVGVCSPIGGIPLCTCTYPCENLY